MHHTLRSVRHAACRVRYDHVRCHWRIGICLLHLCATAACCMRHGAFHTLRCMRHAVSHSLVAMLYCAPCLPERFASTRRYDGVPVVSFGTLREMLPRTLTVNGFSKCYAMTG
jgi:hypothetical protein